jgi:malonate-semialdehyde dehydrogenase (acetylating)/methylmalonate-semialdehyde dehydrogenase
LDPDKHQTSLGQRRKQNHDRDRPFHRQRPRRPRIRPQPARFNPATGFAEKTVALATRAEVDRAVAAAAAAWPTWAKTPSLRRARILDRFKTILWERADQLAEVISAEHGKTHDDAKGEVTRGLEVVEFAVGAPHLLKGGHAYGRGS